MNMYIDVLAPHLGQIKYTLAHTAGATYQWASMAK